MEHFAAFPSCLLCATNLGMTRRDQIEASISALPDDELKRLADWFDELRWQRWDRQIEEDQKAGRLDKFIAKAKADIAAGKTRPL